MKKDSQELDALNTIIDKVLAYSPSKRRKKARKRLAKKSK
jgi:hypothetical protein